MRRLRARDITMLAVMIALVVFVNIFGVFTIQFHAGTALIIICGIGLGPRSGFVVGMIARLLCNFYMGQGPWTPWQMFSWGLLGLLAGVVFAKNNRPNVWLTSIFTFVSVFIVYGGIMNCGAFIMANAVAPVDTPLTWETLLSFYVTGVPYDLIHASGAALCVLVIGDGMVYRLKRVKKKYRITCA